jgi:hypothetical protein
MPLKQITGWFGNLRDLYGNLTLRDLLPPSFISLLVFVRDSVPLGLGFTDSNAQFFAGVVRLTVVMVVASLGFLTFVAVVYFPLAMIFVGLRFFPAVDSWWPWSKSDWPLWEVQ